MPTATALTTDGVGTDASSFATASITPTANRLVLLGVWNTISAGSATLPTATGNGLTYTQVATTQAGLERFTLFRAMGASPSAGAVTIDFGGTTQNTCHWSIVQVADVNTTGTHGSGAIVQSKAGNSSNLAVTSFNLTLDSTPSASNLTLAFIGANTATTFVEEWTQLVDSQGSGGARTISVMYQSGTDTTPSWTFGSSKVGAVAVEVLAASGGITYPPELFEEC